VPRERLLRFRGRYITALILMRGGIAMFARVVEFSPTSEAASHQFVRVIEETALRMVKAQAGCIAAFVELRGQAVLGVSVWESKSDAERFSRECYSDIENILRPFLKCAPELHTFKVREIGSVVMRVRATAGRTPDSQGQAVERYTHPANDYRVDSARSSVSHL
jgi:hypothetical protein